MTSSILRAARPAALVVLLSTLSLFTGCASLGAGGESNAASSVDGEDPDAVAVEEEVPNVGKCHTDTQICELTESLQPGLGCFCDNPDGTKEPGTAGG